MSLIREPDIFDTILVYCIFFHAGIILLICIFWKQDIFKKIWMIYKSITNWMIALLCYALLRFLIEWSPF